jgi:hypothetical protein
MSLRTLLLIAALSVGCTSAFGEAQKADTIEAYEKFLSENPTSPYKLQAESRIEDLMLEKARKEKTLEAYDAVLTRYPKGHTHEKALTERKEFLYKWADETDTVEAWDKFLTEYPKADKKELTEAERRKTMAQHRGSIGVGPIAMEQVNLAKDPNGPLNGWMFSADITNNGDKPIQHLMFRLSYLDADGKPIDSDLWPVVATSLPGGLGMPDGFDTPMKPGETRKFSYDTGDLAPEWGRGAKLVPTEIRFVEPTP